jgi:hypothetical protein
MQYTNDYLNQKIIKTYILNIYFCKKSNCENFRKFIYYNIKLLLTFFILKFDTSAFIPSNNIVDASFYNVYW